MYLVASIGKNGSSTPTSSNVVPPIRDGPALMQDYSFRDEIEVEKGVWTGEIVGSNLNRPLRHRQLHLASDYLFKGYVEVLIPSSMLISVLLL